MPQEKADILIMAGYSGTDGIIKAMKSRRDELEGHFSEAFLRTVKEAGKEDLSADIKGIFDKMGLADIYEVGEEGIFAALWEFGMSQGSGMTADIRKIPVRQEVIEIANFLDINPYEVSGKGSVLAAVNEEEALGAAGEFAEKGIRCCQIGRLNSGNQRLLINKGAKRFLTPASRIEDEKRQRGES